MLVTAALSGCDHSAPFSNPQGTDVPFDPGPAGSADAQSRRTTAIRPGSPTAPAFSIRPSSCLGADGDVCLAELPPTGGSQRQLVCDVPGNRRRRTPSQSPPPAPTAALAFLSAGNGSLGGSSARVHRYRARSVTLDAGNPQTVRSMPFTPSGGTLQDYAGYLRWLTPARLAYVGQTFTTRAICPDSGTVRSIPSSYGTEVTVLDLRPTRGRHRGAGHHPGHRSGHDR